MSRLIATVGAAFVVMSALADNGRSTERFVTGMVVESRPGELISVANETTDPEGIGIALRHTTAYEGQQYEPVDSAVIKPGVRVTVWLRMVGERHPVAHKVRLLTTDTP